MSRRFVIPGLSFATCLGLLHLTLLSAPARAAEPLIHAGDRVALIGGTLVESLQFRGDCEVAVALSQPQLKVPFRNLGWSGDDASGAARRVFGSPADGYTRLFADLEKAAPTVAVIGYGWAEASEGPAGVATFQQNLSRLAGDLRQRNVRLIFILPAAMPGIRTENYQAHIDACRKIIVQVAKATDSPVIDPASSLDEAAYNEAGLRLNAGGMRRFGHALAADLLGIAREQVERTVGSHPSYDMLSELAAEKNALFFHRHRPMNETYLFLFRKHEQGNNAPEVEQFAPLVEDREESLWKLAGQGAQQ